MKYKWGCNIRYYCFALCEENVSSSFICMAMNKPILHHLRLTRLFKLFISKR